MPEAGWYPDPHNPNQQRYWDGSTWTEYTHDAPFQVPEQGPGYGWEAGHSGTQINDIGNWLNRSFKVLFANAMPLFLLLLMVTGLSLVSYWLLVNAVDGASVSFDDGSLDGFDSSRIGLGLAGTVVVMVLSAGVGLAQSRLLHRSHTEQTATLADAIGAGLRNLPRFIGAVLVIYLAVAAILLITVFFVALVAAVVAPLAVLLALLLFVIALVAGVWLWIKTSFFSVTAAAAPRGESIIRTSFGLSSGRFWPVAGRLLLLWVIGIVVTMVVQSISGPAFLSGLTVSPDDGMPLIDGERFDELDRLVIGDLFPLTTTAMVSLAISSLLTGAIGLFSRSGVAALYADLDGPTEPSPASSPEDSPTPAT